MLAGVLASSGILLLRTATPPWRTPGPRAGGPLPTMTVSCRPERLSTGPVRTLVVVAALVLAAALVGLGTLDPLPAIAGAVLAGGLTARTFRERSRTAADRLADAVAEAIGLLAADVSVGRGLGDALQSLSDDLTHEVEEDPSRRRLGLLLAPISEGARLGGHVPAALRELAGVPGCEAFGGSLRRGSWPRPWVLRPRRYSVGCRSRSVRTRSMSVLSAQSWPELEHPPGCSRPCRWWVF